MKQKITFLFITLFTAFLSAQTVEIAGTPYSTIAEAITAATSGDVIDITGVHEIGPALSIPNTFSGAITLRGTDPSTDRLEGVAFDQTNQDGSVTTGVRNRILVLYQPTSQNVNLSIENLTLKNGNSTGQGETRGGAVYVNQNFNGSLSITNCVIDGNQGNEGGAIASLGCDTTITDSTIKNSVGTNGGGMIFTNNGNNPDMVVSISGSLITGNTANNGGGVYVNGNNGSSAISLNIENTTITTNSAVSGTSGAGGGAIWSKVANGSSNVDLKLVHVTIDNNSHSSAAKNGLAFAGGGTNPFTKVEIYNSIIVNGDDLAQKAINWAKAKSVNIVNSILGGSNAAGTAVDGVAANDFLNDASLNNLPGKTATFAGLSSSGLSNEGGPTLVLAISEGSNADDYCTATTGISLPTVDQRGYTREGSADAGAYEFGGTLPFAAPSWAGDWKISPESGSLAVGNAANTSEIWWQSAALTHTERACLYDDIYSFGADGSFQNILGTETWLEGWQGTSPDACGTPVAPHDGSVAATYSYDETAGTVTINGVGAYLGLPKAYNGGELANPADAPSSITYTIESVDSDFMTLYIDVGGNFWRFKLIRADLDILTDVTFSVNTANITVGANGMYLGGGVIGGANAVALSDADSDGTWEATVSLAQGTTGNYIFLNSPNDGGDWGAKENLGGQECADANNYNDRILAAVGSDDYTLMHCFGSCETDGSCPAPLLDPEVCAPVATHLEADVISVYSDAYSANIYTDLNPNWWQATVASEIQIGPDNDCNVLKYESLNYQGLLYQQTDVTTMDYVHLDYYTDNSTAIGFYVIQSGTGENGYFIHDELGITTGEWVSIDIPLSHYTGTDLSGANEIKTDGNGTVYLDNIYFWRDSTASIDENDTSQFSYYPNPVNDALTIKAQKVVEDIKVLNILGQVVKQQTPNTMDCTVDLSAMQSGAYFVQVSIGNTVETVRVLKK